MLEFDAAKCGKTLVIGHRGAHGYAPENTMVSFERGLQCGADLIELDIHLTRDSELVVIHDADVSRTTNGCGVVEKMDLAAIQRLDAGGKFDSKFSGECVPTLKQVLDWARTRIPLVIEIKGDPFPATGIEEKLIDTLRAFNVVDEVMVISFHHHVVQRVKQIAPNVATGILYAACLVDTLGAARATCANSLRPQWAYWTAELVAEVHRAGLIASTWNANDEVMMDYLVPMGLASIGSDYPDRLRAYLDRVGKGWRSPAASHP